MSNTYNISFKDEKKQTRFVNGIIIEAKTESEAIEIFRKEHPKAEFCGMVKND